MSLISIIMANYNGENYIRESIDSIITQTIDEWELIIVDDCSTDSSMRILESYKDDRIKIIKNEKNLGPAKSRNKALKVSKGKYIAILDSDDIAYPERLENQLKVMESREVDILGCGAEFFGKYKMKFMPKIIDKDIRAEIILTSPYVHSTVMIRKETLERLKIVYDEEYKQAQDYKLWSDLSMHNEVKFGALDKILVKYRVHNNQITNKRLNNQTKNASKIRKKQIENLKVNVSEDDIGLIEKFLTSELIGDAFELQRLMEILDLVIESIDNENISIECLINRIKKLIVKSILKGEKVGRIYRRSDLRKKCKNNKYHLILECISIIR